MSNNNITSVILNEDRSNSSSIIDMEVSVYPNGILNKETVDTIKNMTEEIEAFASELKIKFFDSDIRVDFTLTVVDQEQDKDI